MIQLNELVKLVESTSGCRELDNTSGSVERLGLLTKRIRDLQTESHLLDSEQVRMELVIHVAEVNNRQCEFWKESLEQINTNYDKAIHIQSNHLKTFTKEIRDIKELRRDYSSLHTDSLVSHERYLAGMHSMRDTQSQVTEAFLQFDSAIDETSKAVGMELGKIREDSLEESFLRENEEKWMEVEKVRELAQLKALRDRSEHAKELLGVGQCDIDYKDKIKRIREDLAAYKDARERLSDLQIYRDDLKAKYASIRQRRDISETKLKGIIVEKATDAEIQKANENLVLQRKDMQRRGNLQVKSRKTGKDDHSCK